MRVNIEAKSLRAALAKVTIPGASITPGYGAIRIEAGMEGLVLRRFAHHCEIEVTVDADVEEEGNMAVDAESTALMAARLDGTHILIYRDGQNLRMEGSESGLGRMLEIPESMLEARRPLFDAKAKITIAADELAGKLAAAVGAVFRGAESVRPEQQGVSILNTLGRASLVATDGRRCYVLYLGNEPTEIDIMLPTQSVRTLINCLSGESGDVVLEAREDMLLARTASCEARLVLGNAKLGSIEKLITMNTSEFATVDRSALLLAVARAEPLCDDMKRLTLWFRKKAIEIEAGSDTSRNFCVQVPAACANEKTCMANATYLRDMLEAVTGDEVVIHSTTPEEHALIIREEDRLVLLAIIRYKPAAAQPEASKTPDPKTTKPKTQKKGK